MQAVNEKTSQYSHQSETPYSNQTGCRTSWRLFAYLVQLQRNDESFFVRKAVWRWNCWAVWISYIVDSKQALRLLYRLLLIFSVIRPVFHTLLVMPTPECATTCKQAPLWDVPTNLRWQCCLWSRAILQHLCLSGGCAWEYSTINSFITDLF